MKTIHELRNVLKFYPQEINSQLREFSKLRKQGKIDFDVYLPILKQNLQRGYVWDLLQKREIIWSILMERNIPRMAMIFTIEDKYQVIDGKQRLSTMLDFYDNKFTLLIDGKEYLFKDLPKDYQTTIGGYFFAYLVVNDDYGMTINDEQKITWFKFINFAGTPQDLEHLEKLTK